MGKLTEDLPKPMVPVLGKPLLEWKLSLLSEAIEEVILVVGYLEHRIQDYFGKQWHERTLRYVYQETLNGTGGALALTQGTVGERFLVTMGDDLYHPADLERLTHEDTAVLGLEVENAEQYGLLGVNAAGHLLKITERPHGYTKGIVNTGAYVLDEQFFHYPLVSISETEYGLPQTLVEMGKDHPVRVVMATAWQPVGRPEDIEKGEAFLKKHWHP